MNLKSTQANIDFAIKITDDIGAYYHRKEYCEISIFALSMVDRLNYSSVSLKPLLQNLEINSKHEYACGLVIRAVMLDFLIVLNAMVCITSNKNNAEKALENLKEFCIRMLCDTVNNTLNHLEKQLKNDPKEKLEELYLNFYLRYQYLFESYKSDGTKPKIKYSSFKSPYDLYDCISKSEELKRFEGVYEAYNYYSKYDHFGNVFYSMSRNTYESKLMKLDESIKCFINSLYFSIIVLECKNINNPFLKSKREEVKQYIVENGL